LCKFYRCTWEDQEHVYDITHFKTQEMQWCIMNQTNLFTTNGDCLYDCSDCKDNVCDCKTSLGCDTLMTASSVFCFMAATVACCLGVKSCYRFCFKHYIMDEEEAERYEQEKMDILSRKGPKFVTCVFCCMGCVLTGAGIAFLTARDLFE